MIAVIGAGITGLTVGAYLARAGKDVHVFEAENHVGGNIRTLQIGPYTLETGPHTLRYTDSLHACLKDWGLSQDIEPVSARARHRYVLRKDRYRSLPKGPFSLLFSSLLSWRSLGKIIREPRVVAAGHPDESVADFFRRRLGNEITEYLVYPFISGIYAGDPAQLLVAEAFPQLIDWENTHGSLIKGFRQSRREAQHTGIVFFPAGLGQLCDRLQQEIGARLHTGQRLLRLEKPGPFHLHFAGEKLQADWVICTLPAYGLSTVISDWQPALSQALARIQYPPLSVVHTAYARNQVGHSLAGFGALHNRLDPSHSLGTIFTSSLFPNRCPSDEILLTTLVGGSLQPAAALAPEHQLIAGVQSDHQRYLQVRGKPRFQHLIRWPRAIPQYDAHIRGYQPYLAAMEDQGLFLAGNWRQGISVGQCLEQGKNLAERLLDQV